MCDATDKEMKLIWREETGKHMEMNSQFISKSVTRCVYLCVGKAASLQPTVCMLEIWERNQPAASNTEQLSVSWVTQAYCLLATVKCTAGPTPANNTHTHTRARAHTHAHTHTVSISPILSHQTTTWPLICLNAGRIIQ